MELTREMSDKQLFEAGRRMGKALQDSAKGRSLDISLPENYKPALQMLEDFGWGRFNIEGSRITIAEPLLPAPVTHGYLEAALGTTLERLDSVEEIQFFEITGSLRTKITPSISATSRADASRLRRY